MIKCYENGETLNEVAKRFGTSIPTVFKRIRKYVKMRKSPIGNTGDKHSMWRGGKSLKKGYWTVHMPEHPRASSNKRVFEHIVIMENHVGRYIKKGEMIHHIDFDRGNNNLKNLYLCKNPSDHAQCHASLEGIAGELFKKGIIKFLNGRYSITGDLT